MKEEWLNSAGKVTYTIRSYYALTLTGVSVGEEIVLADYSAATTWLASQVQPAADALATRVQADAAAADQTDQVLWTHDKLL